MRFNRTNLPGAAAAAFGAAALGMLVYIGIYTTMHSSAIGYSRFTLGFLVGMAVRRYGKAWGVIPGIIASVATLTTSLLASSIAVMVAFNRAASNLGLQELHISVGQALRIVLNDKWFLVLGIGAAVWAFHSAGGFEELQGGGQPTMGNGLPTPQQFGGPTGAPGVPGVFGAPGATGAPSQYGQPVAPAGGQFAWMSAPVQVPAPDYGAPPQYAPPAVPAQVAPPAQYAPPVPPQYAPEPTQQFAPAVSATAQAPAPAPQPAAAPQPGPLDDGYVLPPAGDPRWNLPTA